MSTIKIPGIIKKSKTQRENKIMVPIIIPQAVLDITKAMPSNGKIRKKLIAQIKIKAMANKRIFLKLLSWGMITLGSFDIEESLKNSNCSQGRRESPFLFHIEPKSILEILKLL